MWSARARSRSGPPLRRRDLLSTREGGSAASQVELYFGSRPTAEQAEPTAEFVLRKVQSKREELEGVEELAWNNRWRRAA